MPGVETWQFLDAVDPNTTIVTVKTWHGHVSLPMPRECAQGDAAVKALNRFVKYADLESWHCSVSF